MEERSDGWDDLQLRTDVCTTTASWTMKASTTAAEREDGYNEPPWKFAGR